MRLLFIVRIIWDMDCGVVIEAILNHMYAKGAAAERGKNIYVIHLFHWAAARREKSSSSSKTIFCCKKGSSSSNYISLSYWPPPRHHQILPLKRGSAMKTTWFCLLKEEAQGNQRHHCFICIGDLRRKRMSLETDGYEADGASLLIVYVPSQHSTCRDGS